MTLSGSDNSAEVGVRRIGADDWELWRDLRLAALRDSPSAFGSTVEREAAFTEEVWRERLADPDSVSVLAELDARPVGIGGGFPEPGTLRVVAMWVAPEARGLRLGHRVLDVIREHAEARGLGLHLDVALSNPAARRSYEAYGFVASGVVRPIRPGSVELVVRMVLDPELTGTRGSR